MPQVAAHSQVGLVSAESAVLAMAKYYAPASLLITCKRKPSADMMLECFESAKLPTVAEASSTDSSSSNTLASASGTGSNCAHALVSSPNASSSLACPF